MYIPRFIVNHLRPDQRLTCLKKYYIILDNALKHCALLKHGFRKVYKKMYRLDFNACVLGLLYLTVKYISFPCMQITFSWYKIFKCCYNQWLSTLKTRIKREKSGKAHNSKLHITVYWKTQLQKKKKRKPKKYGKFIKP